MDVYHPSGEKTSTLLGLLERANLWLRLALSKGPNIVGVFPPHLKTEIDPVYETLCFLVSRIPMDRFQKQEIPRKGNLCRANLFPLSELYTIQHIRWGYIPSTELLKFEFVSTKYFYFCFKIRTRLAKLHVNWTFPSSLEARVTARKEMHVDYE
jgi:hypothetical protein